MIKNITISRAARTADDRAAFRWNWIVALGAGQTDTFTAEWDEDNALVVVERNGELVACYEGRRTAMSLSKAVKSAIDEIYF